MADSIVNNVIYAGTKDYVVCVNYVSDGTGSTDAILIDKSTLLSTSNIEPTAIDIVGIQYAIYGIQAKLEWKHTSDVLICSLGGAAESFGKLCFSHPNGGNELRDSGTGSTGDVVLTTTGHTAGDTATFIFHCKLRP